MSRINQLDSSVYNKIAAGEVVERPCSVVKELVENSIDAGASKIVVEITNGGLRKIRVSDNGAGIHKDDILLAFLPHSTSKITNALDLFTVSTMGFRGEALASIASVSMINIKSKTSNDEAGVSLELKAGDITTQQPCACEVGTSICVENLFFNTPARLSFMKRPKSEENYIKSMISNLVLANSNISFTLIADDKTIIKTDGSGLDNAIMNVYDNEILSNMDRVDYSKGNYKVNGYIGNKNLSKSNRSYQTIIVNGRIVSNSTVSTAVSRAYGNSMMVRCYPVFVLDIIMPFDNVDVNVHPAKTEIRFKEPNIIFGIVYAAVNRTLNELGTKIPEVHNNDNDANLAQEDKEDNSNRCTDYIQEYNNVIIPKSDKSKFINIIASSHNSNKVSENNTISSSIIDNIMQQDIACDSINDVTEDIEDKSYTLVGQLFNTYLIIEFLNEAFFIDQHAAMEAINYNNLTKGIEDNHLKQPLLIPYILNVNHYEKDFIDNNLTAFDDIGVEIEPFGNNSYKVNTIPAMLHNLDLEVFFKNALSELINTNKIKINSVIKDKLAQIACKSSIKGGDKLSKEQINILLNNLCEGDVPLQCPHGRPAIIRLKEKELQKWFKRIQ